MDTSGYKDINHEISIVGWGEQNGIKFWRGRNSWGSHWGEEGFFRIVRGSDNLAIESECSFAVPDDSQSFVEVHETTTEEQNDPNNDTTVYSFPQPQYSGADIPEEEVFLGEKRYGRVPKATFTNGPKTSTHYFRPVDSLPE